jgi:hypothetical protein
VLGTSVVDDAAAWVGLPVAFTLTGLGLGLLLERILRLRLPSTALLPLGACGSICLLLACYQVGAHGWLPPALLLVLAVGGLALARTEWRARLTPGPAAIAGFAVGMLYLAPSVLTGGWTWNGYNFLNDTAVQFLLADELQHYGVARLPDALSTRSEVIRTYIDTGYPLGTHAHLAGLATLLGAGVDVIYQSYIAMLAVTAAVALSGLARRSGLGPWRAAAAGGGALAASLAYHYALQGSIKELAALMALATAAMLGAELLASDRPVALVVALGIAAAAMLGAFSAAAGPYLAALAVCLVVAVLVIPVPAARARLPAIALAGAAATLVAAIPTLISATTFLRISNESLGSGSTVASTLGQLQKPLDAIQVAGVWFSEDYALPVGGDLERRLTVLLSVLVLVLAVAGVVMFVRRRVAGPLLFLGPALAAIAIVAPRASPYADAKLLALASSAVVFVALSAALSWHGRWRTAGAAAAAVAGAAVVASAAFAYHGVRIAPVPRMYALEDAVTHVQDRGWILLDEVEEFGKFYGRDAPHLNVAFESITPRQAMPFGGGYHLDLDQLDARYVQGFDTIITRIGPATSRPPANFRRVYGNRWYEAWEKRDGVEVLAHLPLQDTLDAGATPRCAEIREFARGAPRGARVVAASSPETAELSVVDAPDRPDGWPPLAAPPGVVEPRTPGVVEHRVQIEGGTYDAWIRASTGRALHASVDGRRVGTANALNTQGQWQPAGTVKLGPGRHLLRLERPGGGVGPGDGAKSVLGPLAIVRREPRELREVAPARAGELCGRRWDWIEVVEP